IRMEPQYMMIGEAAGTAAFLAVKKRVAVSQIDVAALQQKLRAQGAVLHLSQEIQSVPTSLRDVGHPQISHQ
ncbi:MAG TPA: FAD-dependent oxidoreductase, partial [Acidobacteriaceae bacterium]|nr:FAD-dependent oxidoreductase [Acidobacteriaceae bacterium]